MANTSNIGKAGRFEVTVIDDTKAKVYDSLKDITYDCIVESHRRTENGQFRFWELYVRTTHIKDSKLRRVYTVHQKLMVTGNDEVTGEDIVDKSIFPIVERSNFEGRQPGHKFKLV